MMNEAYITSNAAKITQLRHFAAFLRHLRATADNSREMPQNLGSLRHLCGIFKNGEVSDFTRKNGNAAKKTSLRHFKIPQRFLKSLKYLNLQGKNAATKNAANRKHYSRMAILRHLLL